MNIKIGENGHVPTRGTEYSAGIDLYCTENVVIPRKSHVKVRTEVYVEIPKGHFGLLCPRSSMGLWGLCLANTVGIIDSDYRGEIICLIKNFNPFEETIKAKERVAQLVIVPYFCPKIEVVEELTETVRGSGGFGSTGV